jgi:hypothetical protein
MGWGHANLESMNTGSLSKDLHDRPRIPFYRRDSWLCCAATSLQGSSGMGSTFNSLVGLIILALDIWAILNVIKSGSEVGIKVLWILLIALLPVIGLVIWAIAGPRGNVRI